MFPILKTKCRAKVDGWEVSLLIVCPEDGKMWVPFRKFGDDSVKAKACHASVRGAKFWDGTFCVEAQ